YQHRLTSPSVPHYIDESARLRIVCSRHTTNEQLEHLEHLALRHNIDIQVLPFKNGAHLGMAGAFTILDFPEPRDPTIVYVSTAADGLYLEQESDIKRYNTAFSNVQGIALSSTASMRSLASVKASIEGER